MKRKSLKQLYVIAKKIHNDYDDHHDHDSISTDSNCNKSFEIVLNKVNGMERNEYWKYE